jgi:ABC-type antimicrobial peptide transport system permease subunit
MGIPISYNFRNLLVRRTTTALTALGIALTVATVMAVLSLVEGLRSSLEASGHPLQAIVMRRGSTAELTSVLTQATYQVIRAHPAIDKDAGGQPRASLEMVGGITPQQGDLTSVANIPLRGLTPEGFRMREEIRISEGRLFLPGLREVVVGKSVAKRLKLTGPGSKMTFARGDWTVVGIVDGGKSAANNEVFGDLNQVSSDYNRVTSPSVVLVRAKDRQSLLAMKSELEADRRLNVQVLEEKHYFRSQMTSALPIQFMGSIVAILLAVGSSFAAMNTMYAAVARRAAEIGTLRVLGFSRGSILGSFLVESVLLALIGAAVGFVLVLPLNDLDTSISSFTTFSEFAFKLSITPVVVATGAGFALVMGVVGGLLPAWSAARKAVLVALRGG